MDGPTFIRARWPRILLTAAVIATSTIVSIGQPSDLVSAGSPQKVNLPLVAGVCNGATGQSFSTTPPNPPPTANAETQPDLNLSMRGYQPTSAYKGLVDYNGGADSGAPQLAGIFATPRGPSFRTVYQVYDWNWSLNQRGGLLTSPPVTLAGLSSTPGETIHVPDSGYTIGDDAGFEVMVLYASTNRITLTYTRNDTAATGYVLHVENVCVDPNLVSLYRAWDNAGRGRLPGLLPHQAFGRATGPEVGVAIRDSGSFMDPRSRKDWWQGY